MQGLCPPGRLASHRWSDARLGLAALPATLVLWLILVRATVLSRPSWYQIEVGRVLSRPSWYQIEVGRVLTSVVFTRSELVRATVRPSSLYQVRVYRRELHSISQPFFFLLYSSMD
jgi:hypothetical protein